MIWTKIIFILVFLVLNVMSSGLNGKCSTNKDCGTLDTYCNNGTCHCQENFAAFFDSCQQIYMPEVECTQKKNNQCHAVMGNKSKCMKGRCVCNPFHHIHDGQCIKSKGLDDICDNNHQCYCGQQCQEKIECFQKTCKCKPGHRQHNRRCVYNSSNSAISYSIITTLLVIPIINTL